MVEDDESSFVIEDDNPHIKLFNENNGKIVQMIITIDAFLICRKPNAWSRP